MSLKKFQLLLILLAFMTPAKSEKLDSLTNNHMISIYSGIFDMGDDERYDQSSLIGLEHRNTNLFKDTILGKFFPITGGFISGKNSIYLYTGIEAQYNIGRLKIKPSLASGYYEAGNGKKLGSLLEFKSEIKFDIDIFSNSKIGYSFSHISNNDWGDINPGINNSTFSFSKIF